MNRIVLACTSSLLSVCSMAAHFSVKIVDAVTEKPLQGVKVLGWFSNDNGWRAWTESAPEYVDNGVTDKNGKCRLSGTSNTGKVGFIVKEPPSGYYPGPNVKLQLSRDMLANLSGLVTGGPEELLRLDRIGNTIPLFVKHVKLKDREHGLGGFDGTNSVIRFDMVKGDWLLPYGNGEVADVEFHSTMQIKGRGWYMFEPGKYDWVYFYQVNTIAKCPNPSDGFGVVEPREDAGIKVRMFDNETLRNSLPLMGIGRNQKFERNGKDWNCQNYREDFRDRCLVFRIRSKFDNKGKLVEAYYGKIYGDFTLYGYYDVGLHYIEFLYYLNPTPLDRNLEWDMKNNLCPNPGKIGAPQP